MAHENSLDEAHEQDESEPYGGWNLLLLEDGYWHEIGGRFNTKEDALRAMVQQQDQAGFEEKDVYFAVMHEDEKVYPPDPRG